MRTDGGHGDRCGEQLLALYERSLPQVYGYLFRRTGSAAVAEDLTSETFVAAVGAIRNRTVERVSTAWLVGIARHKLVDHWRAAEREERRVSAVAVAVAARERATEDPWDEHLDAHRAHRTLAMLAVAHRTVLTLRYVDGLPVPDVAASLGRTVHATEALLVRAKRAFRSAYGQEGADHDA